MNSIGIDMKNVKENIMKDKTSSGLIIVFVVILAIVAYNVYSYYKKKSKMIDIPSSSSKSAEVLFFFTNWCPHCTSAKPEWEAFTSKYANEEVNGYKLIFTGIDCTKESADSEVLMEKYKVEGYPTIKLLANDKVYDFDAKPTSNNLTQFVTSILK